MTFAEEFTAAVAETGLKLTAVARELGIPYRTAQNWKNGVNEPNNFTRIRVMTELNSIIHSDRYWFHRVEDKYGCQNTILVEHAESFEDAIDQLRENFKVVEVFEYATKTALSAKQIFAIRNEKGVYSKWKVVIENF